MSKNCFHCKKVVGGPHDDDCVMIESGLADNTEYYKQLKKAVAKIRKIFTGMEDES